MQPLGAREGKPFECAGGRAPRRFELRRSEDYSGPFSRLPSASVAAAVYRRPVPDALLDDLDSHQRAAVVSTAAPLAIIAPAGSGKTRVLTRRVAYRVREGLADGRHVLAVTFTRRAAGELVARLGALGAEGPISAGTFHAIALAQLRRFAAERNRETPRVLERKARVLGPLMTSRGREAAAAGVNDVAAEIEWAKARLVAPERYELAVRAVGRRVPRPAAQIADLYARYELEKRRRHLVDFDDVLRTTADLIEGDETLAAVVRFRVRHLFVDEFQDATPLQLRVVRAWLGASRDLTVVGDPAQAIYGFAGADAAPLVEFERAFPGSETIALTRNYRSTPAIVAVAEAALGSVDTGAREQPAAVRPDGERPVIVAYADADAEAAAIADACWRAYADGVPWARMAVLFRTNAQSAGFEAAFARRGVPFRAGDASRFAARPEVRAMLDWLHRASAEQPGRPLAHVLADFAADLDAPATEELLEQGREYVAAEGDGADVAGFATWLDVAGASVDSATDAPGSGVQLVTFHRAKGLEWDLVFVTGLERGLVPIAWATTPEARAEERRLLHVALSRARDELRCSWARSRAGTRRTASREPSPFLGALEHEAVAARVETLPALDHLAELRTTLAAASPPAPPVHRARRLRH